MDPTALTDDALMRALRTSRQYVLTATGRSADGWVIQHLELSAEAARRGLIRTVTREEEE